MKCIVCAEVIHDEKSDGLRLMNEFSSLVENMNERHADILSEPMEIVLDEFQGVIENLKSAILFLVDLEEEIVRSGYALDLRLAVREFEVDKSGAVELASAGLQGLVKLKRKFHFSLANEVKARALDHGFFVYGAIIKDWNEQDRLVTREFFDEPDYKKVAEIIGKDPSSVWRRKKTLKIDNYNEIKLLIKELAEI